MFIGVSDRLDMCRRLFFSALFIVAAAVIPVDRVDANFGTGIVHGDIVSEAPSSRVPRVINGKVWAIAQWGDLVVVGGKFSQVRVAGGAVLERSNIFAFWRSTGAIDRRFAPAVSGTVRAIALDPQGRGVFVGGQFGRINGESRRGLALLSRDGVRVPGWAGRPNGVVFDLAVRGDQLYVGGKFSRLTGVNRNVFGTVNVSNGRTSSESAFAFADPRYSQFRGALEIRRFEISPDGSRMVALGNFQTVDGARRDQVVVLDVGASPDRLTNWSTTFFDEPCNAPTTVWPSIVRDVSISPDGSYFVVASVGGPQPGSSYHPCDTAARLELNDSSNQVPTWVEWSGGDSILSVEITGEAVYIGGHFRWLNNLGGDNGAAPGSIARGTLAALDPSSGALLDWNPTRSPRGQGVLVMEASQDGLWIGHDTGFVNGTYSPRLTHFALQNSLVAQITSPEQTGAPGRVNLAGIANGSVDIVFVAGTLRDAAGRFLHPDGVFRGDRVQLDLAIDGLRTRSASYSMSIPFLPAGTYTFSVEVIDDSGREETAQRSFTLSSQSTNIRVGAGKIGGGYNISSGSLLAQTRSLLLDQSAFGPAGTYNIGSVTIIDDVPTITQAYLDDIDVLFSGFVADSDWTFSELALVESWVRAGGVVISANDDPDFDAIASQFGNRSVARGGTPTWTAQGNNPIVNGPFGSWFTITGGGWISYFDEVPGWSVIARDGSNLPTLVTRRIGNGLVILSADEGIFRTGFPGSNRTMVGNLFAMAFDAIN